MQTGSDESKRETTARIGSQALFREKLSRRGRSGATAIMSTPKANLRIEGLILAVALASTCAFAIPPIAIAAAALWHGE